MAHGRNSKSLYIRVIERNGPAPQVKRVADRSRERCRYQLMATKDRGIFFLRAVVGLGMLFAGLDKFFMWASGTPFTSAGYLTHATGGSWLGSAATTIVNPTNGFWVSLGHNATLVPIVDTLVVFG